MLRTCLLVLLVPLVARAELRELQIVSREPYAGGKNFGDAGPYEMLTGIARFAVDPKHPRNAAVVDLALAPVNGEGRVEFEADFYILAPKDRGKGNGAILYDVNNRGNKLALGTFGDAFLCGRGFTLVGCGWIGELHPGGGRLLLKAPLASDKGTPIRGPVRYEMVTDTPAEVMPLSGNRANHGSYPPTAEGEKNGILTWRARETDARVVIPRGQWSLQRGDIPQVEGRVTGTLPLVQLKLAGGFRPGYLYELVCECENPIVQGLGFVAVRDFVSFLSRDTTGKNPLRSEEGKSLPSRTLGFGTSQSGRFLRQFVYEGFNADEKGRRVFDAILPHVAGGGLGSFNHRFAQPTRHNGQHENHLYPADGFPFTYGDTADGFTRRTDGLLRRLRAEDAKLLPKVMQTNSMAEYWHRAGSLIHTTPDNLKDAAIPDEVRIYAIGGTQHGPASMPPTRGLGDNLPNPGDYRPILRALLVALDAWAKDGTAPPPSVYPRIDQGTLVPWTQAGTGFPALPGVRYPEVIHTPCALDLGPDFATKGIITKEPPGVTGHYRVLVAKCDADGNDLGTIRPPEVAVPLATFTGWNLRKREAGAEGMLASLLGSYIPFAKTKAERELVGDPRLSIAERYGTFAEYQKRYAAACAELVKRRLLLPDEAEWLIAGRAKVREMFPE